MLHSELMHMLMLYNYDCTLTVYKEKQYNHTLKSTYPYMGTRTNHNRKSTIIILHNTIILYLTLCTVLQNT